MYAHQFVEVFKSRGSVGDQHEVAGLDHDPERFQKVLEDVEQPDRVAGSGNSASSLRRAASIFPAIGETKYVSTSQAAPPATLPSSPSPTGFETANAVASPLVRIWWCQRFVGTVSLASGSG